MLCDLMPFACVRELRMLSVIGFESESTDPNHNAGSYLNGRFRVHELPSGA